MGLCLLMPVDVIGLGLSQRPGNPQALELSHPLFMHQTLTVVDGFVAGLHRSCCQRLNWHRRPLPLCPQQAAPSHRSRAVASGDSQQPLRVVDHWTRSLCVAPLGDESGDECSLGLTMEEHFGSPTV